MVDADVLRQSGVSADIFCPTDFASDILLLKSKLCNSVQNIHQHMSSGVSYALDCDV